MHANRAVDPGDRIIDLKNGWYLQPLNLRVTLEYVFSTQIMGTLQPGRPISY